MALYKFRIIIIIIMLSKKLETRAKRLLFGQSNRIHTFAHQVTYKSVKIVLHVRGFHPCSRET